MTLQQAIKHYKNREALAAALHVRPATIVQWHYRDAIPREQQLALQIITNGKLKAD